MANAGVFVIYMEWFNFPTVLFFVPGLTMFSHKEVILIVLLMFNKHINNSSKHGIDYEWFIYDQVQYNQLRYIYIYMYIYI